VTVTGGPSISRRRAAFAVATSGAVVLLALGDAAFGSGRAIDSPVLLLASAVTAYLLGAWAPLVVAGGVVLVGDLALTVANQLGNPGDYPVADDLTFFLLVLGGPAVAGASLVRRAAQVGELGLLSARLTAQRRDDLRAARIEEQQRIELQVHQRLVEQMGAIALRAEGAQRSSSATVRRLALRDVEATARAGLTDLREVLGVLREPEVFDHDLPAQPAARRTAARPGWYDVALAVGCGSAIAVESVVRDLGRGPGWLNVVAAFVVAAPLVVRRGWPVPAAAAVFLVGAVTSSQLTPLPGMVTAITLLLVTSYAVGAHADSWRRPVGVAVIWLGSLLLAAASPSGARDPEGLLPSLLWSGLAVAAGMLAAGWSARESAMRQAVAELERGRDRAAATRDGPRPARLGGPHHDRGLPQRRSCAAGAGSGHRRCSADHDRPGLACRHG